MNKDIKIGLIQMSCSTDLEKNLKKTIDNIKKVANLGAQIVCTQELFKSPYFCLTADSDLFDLAEKIDEENSTIKKIL